MRSSSGPCGLDSQRFLACAASSAITRPCRKIPDASSIQRIGELSLKRVRTITADEAAQGAFHAAAYREHLEELAHLGGRKELLRFGGDRRVVQRMLGVRLAEHVGDAAVHEKLRLRGVAEDFEPRVHGGVCERSEIDVRGDVLVAGMREHVGVRAMAVMAHERAGRALWMVILAARKAGVENEDRPFLEALAELAHAGLGDEAHLALVWGVDLDLARLF